MSFSDAAVKLLSENLVVWQIFTLRSIVAVLLLLISLRVLGRSINFGISFWINVRSLLIVLTWLFFYGSLPLLELSMAATAVYTNPIWIAIFSYFLLNERITRFQLMGVFLGFLGVVVIFQPGSGDLRLAVALPLLASLLYALAMVATKGKCENTDTSELAINLNIHFIIFGFLGYTFLSLVDLPQHVVQTNPFVFVNWRDMVIFDWLAVLFLGAFSTLFFWGVAYAYQTGRPQVMAVIDYSYLFFAAVWGVTLFKETLSSSTLVGSALIVLAGILSSGVLSRQR
jgi:drug/metabolite transporter (DMT)-like permease